VRIGKGNRAAAEGRSLRRSFTASASEGIASVVR
jgi:hypothetical protein